MGGARLGHKVLGGVARIGKKVLKGAAVGAAIGGALLVGASYHIGQKEVTKQTANQNRIRNEAEEDMKRREDEIASGKKKLAAEKAKMAMEKEHQDSFVVSDEGLKQKDPTLVVAGKAGSKVAAAGPQMDPLDFAAAQAQNASAAAASFESKKIGGLKQKLTPSNPFKKKSP
tara:strand:- start:2246 stop:2761 length:516 start_codon:yes stop_codon:yes gene_type:complete